ncbi:MAG: murein biosynthesis integral membrane protein MurJ [Candidatus Magnetomorum sp.]|nr:murein biosynthesis integral membrane protein MurJ [Candidatus Magnetomorum sp.]
MTSINKKVGFAALIMMISIFLSRFIGLFREMTIAYVGGAGSEVDAYQLAFMIPEILNHVAASGFLSITFIPIFTQYLANNDETNGWRIFSIIINTVGSVLIVLIALTTLFTRPLIYLLAPGITNSQTIDCAVTMTRIIMPAQFFFFIGGIFMAVQYAHERFIFPALAPLIYNLGIIIGGIFLGSRMGMQGFSYGVLAGAFVGNFLLQYIGAKRVGMRYSFSFSIRHPDFRKYILLTLPLMIGMTMLFSTEICFKFFGSYLPAGNIAALNYAFRVMFMMVGFFGQAIGVASFPYLSQLAARKDISSMNTLLNDTLNHYIALIIPFSVLLAVLRHEIIFILFQRGKFTSGDTYIAANILMFLMIGAFAFAAQTVVVRGYYAMQNTFFPAIFSTLAVLISVPLYFLGLHYMGVYGIALAMSVSAIVQVVLLYALWNRRTQNTNSWQVYMFFLKVILLSMPLGVIAFGCRFFFIQWFPPNGIIFCLITSSLTGMFFLIFLIALGYVFKIDSIMDMVQKYLIDRNKKKLHESI